MPGPLFTVVTSRTTYQPPATTDGSSSSQQETVIIGLSVGTAVLFALLLLVGTAAIIVCIKWGWVNRGYRKSGEILFLAYGIYQCHSKVAGHHKLSIWQRVDTLGPLPYRDLLVHLLWLHGLMFTRYKRSCHDRSNAENERERGMMEECSTNCPDYANIYKLSWYTSSHNAQTHTV